VTGCTKVSRGCTFCYAETMAHRFWPSRDSPVVDAITGRLRPRRFTDVQCHETRLDTPLHWRKPARVFVNSMSDLFHETVPDAFIDRVFAVMARCPQHAFQVLTKRPERMRAYLSRDDVRQLVIDAGEQLEPSRPPRHWYHVSDWRLRTASWPLPNVWLGVSVEDQATADVRIPLLLQTPAALRFASLEPLLGPVDLARATWPVMSQRTLTADFQPHLGLNWAIVGGESGPQARSCHILWIRDLLRQCREARLAAFVKQLGRRPVGPLLGSGGKRSRKWNDPSEWPEDLRVREWPVSVFEVPA
jgi:protein gp37